MIIGIMFTQSIGGILENSAMLTLSGDILYVGGNEPGNFSKIQDAIDNASAGDTIYVFNGTYYENVRVNKPLILLGEERDTTIIDANGNDCPVILKANSIKITGFTLQNSGNEYYNDAGIQIKNSGSGQYSNNNIIAGNKVINNLDGIFIFYSRNNVVSDNIIGNNMHTGIFTHGRGYNNTLYGNIVANNECNGIYLFNSDEYQISNNCIYDNKDIGIYLWNALSNNIFENNISNNSIGIFLGDRSWNNRLHENVILSNKVGIDVGNAPFTIIRKNNFLKNDIHAKFIYSFLHIITFPPIFWIRNYWDDGVGFGPKVIKGEFYIEIVPLLPHKPVIILWFPWWNFDFLPAKEPYDIDVLK